MFCDKNDIRRGRIVGINKFIKAKATDYTERRADFSMRIRKRSKKIRIAKNIDGRMFYNNLTVKIGKRAIKRKRKGRVVIEKGNRRYRTFQDDRIKTIHKKLQAPKI